MKKLGLVPLAIILMFAIWWFNDNTKGKKDAQLIVDAVQQQQSQSKQIEIENPKTIEPAKPVDDKNLNKTDPTEQKMITPGTYFQYQPTVEKNNSNKDIYLLEGNYYIFIGPNNPGVKGRFNSSPTLYLLGKSNGSFETIYRSSHSGDSYILRPTFYKTISNDDPIIILAETGAEYSWGARVFIVKGSNVIDAGNINLAVPARINCNSVIPYTKINIVSGQIQFTFNTDVIYDPGGKNDKTLSKEDIKYIYENGKLRVEMK